MLPGPWMQPCNSNRINKGEVNDLDQCSARGRDLARMGAVGITDEIKRARVGVIRLSLPDRAVRDLPCPNGYNVIAVGETPIKWTIAPGIDNINLIVQAIRSTYNLPSP